MHIYKLSLQQIKTVLQILLIVFFMNSSPYDSQYYMNVSHYNK